MRILLLVCLLSGVVAHAQEAAAEVPLRKPSLDATAFTVPYGVAYIRAAWGGSLQYQIPLVQQPGILWDTTNVAFGLREMYGYVVNSLTGYAEITPIAFFKLNVSASHDMFIIDPFSGGVRVLTPEGEERLRGGQVRRGDVNAVDWVDGQNNRLIFSAPTFGQGLRLRVTPTLQGRLGPVAFQYNFTWDYNDYFTGRYGPEAVFHDTISFTLRKLRDTGVTHEAILLYEVPGIQEQVRLGVVGRHYVVMGTGLVSQSVVGLFSVRAAPGWLGMSKNLAPWVIAQVGTNTIDPLHQFDLSWVLVAGMDFHIL